MKTSRRGFLSKIFASAIAAPAVTKLIAGGISKPPEQCDCIACTGVMDWSGVSDWDHTPYLSQFGFPSGTFHPLRKR